MDFSAEQLHAEDVGLLASDVYRAHIDVAFQAEQGASGRRSDAVLPRAGFGNDALFAHTLRENRLTERVVDLVRAGVIEVLALEIQAQATGIATGTTLELRIAVDYSARDILRRAAALHDGAEVPDRETFAGLIAQASHGGATSPDVDMLIRTGGETRVSDFLLFEAAYAESQGGSGYSRPYFEVLGVRPKNIVFSDPSSEEMFAEGGKYGSVDPCYPSKVAQAHFHQLFFHKHVHSPLDAIFFPILTHVPNFVTGTVDNTSCPIVAGTPDVMKAAFTKEQDYFANRGIEYMAPAFSFSEPTLLKRAMFEAFERVLGVTEDESDFATQEGLAALERFDQDLQDKGRAILGPPLRKQSSKR